MTAPAVKQTIKNALAPSFPLATVLQQVSGLALEALSERIGFPRPEVSMCILGYRGRPYPKIRNEIAGHLRAERDDVDRWIVREQDRDSDAGAVR